MIERKSFGIKELATGYFIRSNRKEEEQAMLKEIRLIMIDMKRGRPGRVCMDTYNWSTNWGKDSRNGSQLEWEPILSWMLSASGYPSFTSDNDIIFSKLNIGEINGKMENKSLAWSKSILSHKARKSFLSRVIQFKVFLISIMILMKKGRNVKNMVRPENQGLPFSVFAWSLY